MKVSEISGPAKSRYFSSSTKLKLLVLMRNLASYEANGNIWDHYSLANKGSLRLINSMNLEQS